MARARVIIRDTKTNKTYESMFAAGKALAKLVKGDPADRLVWFSVARAFPGRFVAVNPDGSEIAIEDRKTRKKAEVATAVAEAPAKKKKAKAKVKATVEEEEEEEEYGDDEDDEDEEEEEEEEEPAPKARKRRIRTIAG